jgi:tellurite resistance protein TehA-like permease
MKKISFLLFVYVVPVIASAQLKQTGDLLTEAKRIVIDVLIPLAFALAMLFFFWGLAKYIRSTGTEKEEGRNIMVWGVVALFVMSSVWGLVRFIQGNLAITNNGAIDIPTFK